MRGQAPFVATRRRNLKEIIGGIDLKSGEIVYELGCGSAIFLKTLFQRFPQAAYRGVEYSFWLSWLAKLRSFLGRTPIQIIRQNIFKVSLAEADLIYCYLNPEMMARLGEKIRRECRPGTRVVSNQFSLPGYQLEKILTVNKEKIFFYKI